MAIMAGEAITEGGTSGMRAASAKRARRGRQQLKSRKVTRRRPIGGEMGGTEVETETYGPGPRGRGRDYASRYGQQAAAA